MCRMGMQVPERRMQLTRLFGSFAFGFGDYFLSSEELATG